MYKAHDGWARSRDVVVFHEIVVEVGMKLLGHEKIRLQ